MIKYVKAYKTTELYLSSPTDNITHLSPSPSLRYPVRIYLQAEVSMEWEAIIH